MGEACEHTTAQETLSMPVRIIPNLRASGLYYLPARSTLHLFTSTAFIHTHEGRTYGLCVSFLPAYDIGESSTYRTSC
jgi:hypothetical protein